MPARKKLLPRPCPQCGCEYGGVQWMIFNPEFYSHRDEPYSIIRISHGYSKTEKTKNNTRKKIVHNFQVFNGITVISPTTKKDLSPHQIFEDISYSWRKSISFPLSRQWFEFIKERGWSALINERPSAHFKNKPGPKQCQKCEQSCEIAFKFEYPEMYEGLIYHVLCGTCVREEQIRTRTKILQKKEESRNKVKEKKEILRVIQVS